MKKIITFMLIAALLSLMLTATAAAPSHIAVTGYDNDTDYMALMIECAEDGSKYALAVGWIYEEQRNHKIATEGYDYIYTHFFNFDDAEYIRECIEKYLAPPPEPEPTEKLEHLGVLYITGYDPYCSHCCGKTDGITASGAKAIYDYTIAMSSAYSFGTVIYIEGLGTYVVEDRGVGFGTVDVARNGHDACYAITGNYDVYIVT